MQFQGGSFDAWGPTAPGKTLTEPFPCYYRLNSSNIPGYEPCLQLTGPDFQSVFNLNLWAANAKMINYYMIYGCINV